jgi:hypothetical protein
VQLSTESLLSTLTRARLLAIGREFGVAVPSSLTKEEQVERLKASKQVRFGQLIGWMGRDELRAACRAHDLDDTDRSRQILAGRLMKAHGTNDSVPPLPSFWLGTAPRYAPQVGDIVHVRKRQWLAESVVAPHVEGDATRVGLVCLDDDNQGKTSEVLWELELGARVVSPQTHGLGEVKRLDPPRHFAALLTSLQKRGEVNAPVGRRSRTTGALSEVTSSACSSRSPS